MTTTPKPTIASAPTLARLRAGELQSTTHLDLRGCGLTELPAEVLTLADTLQVLDVSCNAFSTLPDGLARLTKLHTLFASNNRFTTLPPVLGRLAALDTLGFKANQIAEVPAAALAPTLRWLILTDNRIAALPPTLTDCTGLQKLMLAANRFERADHALPDELLALPRLAWLAHAGNPFGAAREQAAQAVADARAIGWAELRVQGLVLPRLAAHWAPLAGPRGGRCIGASACARPDAHT